MLIQNFSLFPIQIITFFNSSCKETTVSSQSDLILSSIRWNEKKSVHYFIAFPSFCPILAWIIRQTISLFSVMATGLLPKCHKSPVKGGIDAQVVVENIRKKGQRLRYLEQEDISNSLFKFISNPLIFTVIGHNLEWIVN